jgi:hypothetical protein
MLHPWTPAARCMARAKSPYSALRAVIGGLRLSVAQLGERKSPGRRRFVVSTVLPAALAVTRLNNIKAKKQLTFD